MESAIKLKNSEPVADPRPQLEYGMEAIARFYGMPTRQAFHHAAKGHLAGVFKTGRLWTLDKEAARDGIRARATRTG